jgi:hypothetical protein
VLPDSLGKAQERHFRERSTSSALRHDWVEFKREIGKTCNRVFAVILPDYKRFLNRSVQVSVELKVYTLYDKRLRSVLAFL